MKQLVFLVATFICIIALGGCGADYNDFEIKITIPAGSTGEFIYSDEQISTNQNSISFQSNDDFADAEIILKAVEAKEENAYEPTTFTTGIPINMEVEKNAWFQIGVAIPNETDEDITVEVNASDIMVRIE